VGDEVDVVCPEAPGSVEGCTGDDVPEGEADENEPGTKLPTLFPPPPPWPCALGGAPPAFCSPGRSATQWSLRPWSRICWLRRWCVGRSALAPASVLKM
jgi:hypothetical protein